MVFCRHLPQSHIFITTAIRGEAVISASKELIGTSLNVWRHLRLRDRNKLNRLLLTSAPPLLHPLLLLSTRATCYHWIVLEVKILWEGTLYKKIIQLFQLNTCSHEHVLLCFVKKNCTGETQSFFSSDFQTRQHLSSCRISDGRYPGFLIGWIFMELNQAKLKFLNWIFQEKR